MNLKQISVFVLTLAMLLGPQPFALGRTIEPAPVPEGEDVVLRWNRVLIETLQTPGQQPSTIVAGRSLSMVHAAIFDAVNSIDGSYKPYLTDVPGSKHASIEAAAAKAARDVLASLYPTRTGIFDAEFAASIAGLEENRVLQGIRVGEIVAQGIITARSNDGWTADRPAYVLPADPGNWQPAPPSNAAAALTHFPNVKPFALQSGSQFMPPPPPAITSDAYAAALNEVKELGSVNSSTRTADQTQQAQAWASVGNPTAAPIVWNRIAATLAVSHGNTTVENARMFALLNISHHDAFQTTFASKYHYGLWRPVTAIRRADEDGNPNTTPDTNWSSLINTPPYPTYAGNMATIGWSNAAMLALFFGRDDLAVQYTFPTGATRSYASLSSVAEEMGRSRIYGGIHFEFDSVAGRSIGMNTSNYVYLNFMTPR
jgi:hypothetical protein